MVRTQKIVEQMDGWMAEWVTQSSAMPLFVKSIKATYMLEFHFEVLSGKKKSYLKQISSNITSYCE